MTAPSQVGAFFDLDGTLLRKPSLERRFFTWLLSRHQLGSRFLIRWLAPFARDIWRNPRLATNANKHYLKGVPVSFVADWAVSLKPDALEVCPQGLSRISWHMSQQHRVFIVSGALAPLARIFASQISPDADVAATELEVENGRWTGSLAGEHLSGDAKSRAIATLVAKHDLRLDRSYAYGNAMADFAMLDCVAHPHAVNPSLWLRYVASKRKWPIVSWQPSHAPHRGTLFTAKEIL